MYDLLISTGKTVTEKELKGFLRTGVLLCYNNRDPIMFYDDRIYEKTTSASIVSNPDPWRLNFGHYMCTNYPLGDVQNPEKAERLVMRDFLSQLYSQHLRIIVVNKTRCIYYTDLWIHEDIMRFIRLRSRELDWLQYKKAVTDNEKPYWHHALNFYREQKVSQLDWDCSKPHFIEKNLDLIEKYGSEFSS